MYSKLMGSVSYWELVVGAAAGEAVDISVGAQCESRLCAVSIAGRMAGGLAGGACRLAANNGGSVTSSTAIEGTPAATDSAAPLEVNR